MREHAEDDANGHPRQHSDHVVTSGDAFVSRVPRDRFHRWADARSGLGGLLQSTVAAGSAPFMTLPS